MGPSLPLSLVPLGAWAVQPPFSTADWQHSWKRREMSHIITMGWFRCHLSFSLVRSAILCIRGTRSKANFIPRVPDSTDLAVAELHTPI